MGARTDKRFFKRRGLMLVLSSPSGAGKTTISRALLQHDSNLRMSVSVTTRAQRPGEREGIDYYFLDKPTFMQKERMGELLEHAVVFGNHYGTPREPVERALAEGTDVLFDIDWQGTQQLRGNANTSTDLVSIFILPPTVDDLERRLRTRAQDSVEVVRGRMAKASDEMSHYAEYDYIIVNENVEESVREVQAIVTAERLKRDRLIGLPDFVNELRLAAG
jgi:guanylate kinase